MPKPSSKEWLLIVALAGCLGFTILLLPTRHDLTANQRTRSDHHGSNHVPGSLEPRSYKQQSKISVSDSPPSIESALVMDEEPLPSGFIRASAAMYIATDLDHIWMRLRSAVEEVKSEITKISIVPPLFHTKLENQVADLASLADQLFWKEHTNSLVSPVHEKKDIIIGILSARNHSELRRAQRETWIKLLRKTPEYKDRLLVRFIVGEIPCPIPPENRIDAYSCESIPLTDPALGEDHTAVQFSSASGRRAFNTPRGSDFRTNLWTVITHLGVYDSGTDGLKRELSVSLWDTDSRTLLRKAVFKIGETGQVINGARFLQIEPLLLPKGFHATIVSEGYGQDEWLYNRIDGNSLNVGGGIISFLPGTRVSYTPGTFPESKEGSDFSDLGGATFIYRTDRLAPNVMITIEWKQGITYSPVTINVGDVLKFRKTNGMLSISQCESVDPFQKCDTCRVVSPPLKEEFEYNAKSPGDYYFLSAENCHDGMKVKIIVQPKEDLIETLKRERSAQVQREKSYKAALTKEEESIQLELKQHNDIVLIPGFLDTYRRLPLKLLEMYRWASQFRFNFLLKTDDDSFLDIASVVQAVETLNLRGKKKVWWSRFRKQWPLDKTGKWKEVEYTSPVYPAFACGGANVLSADLVKWLSKNRNDLKPYQGEDVSAGIWLSAVFPTIINDINWRCFGDCKKEGDSERVFNLPEQSPQGLRSLWSNLTACGRPCDCS